MVILGLAAALSRSLEKLRADDSQEKRSHAQGPRNSGRSTRPSYEFLQRIFAWLFGSSVVAQAFEGDSVLDSINGARSILEPLRSIMIGRPATYGFSLPLDAWVLSRSFACCAPNTSPLTKLRLSGLATGRYQLPKWRRFDEHFLPSLHPSGAGLQQVRFGLVHLLFSARLDLS